MQTKPKSNSIMTTVLSQDGNTITFKVAGAGECILDLTKLSEANRIRAIQHGMTQRISDGAALSRNPETGKPATPADKLAAMKVLVDHYNSGTSEWSRARAASGPTYTNGLLGECLKRLYPEKSEERIAAYLKGLKPSERTQLLASDKIRPIAEQIRNEAAATIKVDADKLLAGLDDEPTAIPGAIIEQA